MTTPNDAAPSGETLPEDDITCDAPVCFRRLVPEGANLDGRDVSECRACGALFYSHGFRATGGVLMLIGMAVSYKLAEWRYNS